MNVKLKKRMTGLFEDLEPGDMFRMGKGYAVCMKIESVDIAYGGSYNAVTEEGCPLYYDTNVEVEVIHGTFVEDGAE